MSRAGIMRSILAFFLALLVGSATAGDSASTWRKFDVPVGSTYHVTDANGVERDIAPSCSGGPVCGINASGALECHEGNKQFSFYYKPGSSDKVVVFFDEGGACWDSNTCVTGNQTPLSTYVPEIGPSSDPANMGGLFDVANKANPYRDWSMVVIPYCTGDIHWGSKDETYTDYTGAVTGAPGGSVTIHHRGFDNFLYVREWMKNRFSARERDEGIKKLLVTGSSAGAYGSAFAYPHLKQAFPRAKGYLMADAGNGVIIDDFRDQALNGPDARWGIQGNLAHWVPGMDGFPSTPSTHLIEAIYFALAGAYPNDRFSQYTSYADIIQVLFYNIMLNQNDLAAWAKLTPDVYGAWVKQMVDHVWSTANNPNYRFFVAEGCNHTVLPFSDDFYQKTNPLHSKRFLPWFRALTQDEDGAGAWKNEFCTSCSTPTPEQMNACLMRSFNQ